MNGAPSKEMDAFATLPSASLTNIWVCVPVGVLKTAPCACHVPPYGSIPQARLNQAMSWNAA
ncbi:MAG: hypothetical protein E6J58_00335 [Deltaproteobacteria bacterium]|nr:MAG: hypothetical protein E6J58_00335 [Deltaproteobacteria bacterium]